MIRSFGFVLSLAVAVQLTSHVRASCNSTTVDKCTTQLGLNTTSYSIKDCYQTAPDECTSAITLQGCNTTVSTTASYIVLCTAAGLQFYNSDNQCVVNNYTSLTSDICNGRLLNCSGGMYLTASVTTAILRRMNNCTTPKPPSSTGLQLIPNPVGPEAITAIVVIICLVITGILAGFFFWPKCHIADPAAQALKKATKPAAAKAASLAAGATGGSSSQDNNARVVYEPDKKMAHIKLPSIPGPSAA